MILTIPYNISEKELQAISFLESESCVLLKQPEHELFVAKPVVLSNNHVASFVNLMKQTDGYAANYATVEFPVIVNKSNLAEKNFSQYKRITRTVYNKTYVDIVMEGPIANLLQTAQRYGVLNVVLVDIDPRLSNNSNVLTIKPRLGFSETMQCYIS